MSHKISVGTWAFCFGPYLNNPIPLDVVLEESARLNFDGVSLGGFKPHAHRDLYPTTGDRKKLVKRIADCGLEVAEYGSDLWSLDALTQTKDYLDLYTKFLHMAADCGFSMIRVDSGHPPILPAGMSLPTAKEIVVDVFRKMADLASPYGITVVWEFEPGFLFNKPSEIISMSDWVDRSNFMYMLDSCHAHMCASVGARQMGGKETLKDGEIELISRLKGRIKIVHLIDSDNTLHDEDTSTHAPFGTGVIDFPKVIEVIMRTEYKGPWFVLDLCFWPDAWNVVRESKSFLDRLLMNV